MMMNMNTIRGSRGSLHPRHEKEIDPNDGAGYTHIY